MTMDRVLDTHQQHGFQQQVPQSQLLQHQQQTQQHHHHQQSQQPLQPNRHHHHHYYQHQHRHNHTHHHNSYQQQQPPATQSQLDHQVLYRNGHNPQKFTHQTHHFIQPNNQTNNNTSVNNNTTAATNSNTPTPPIPPLLIQRPLHPPPPPPPPSITERFIPIGSDAIDHSSISTTNVLINPNQLQNSIKPINNLIDHNPNLRPVNNYNSNTTQYNQTAISNNTRCQNITESQQYQLYNSHYHHQTIKTHPINNTNIYNNQYVSHQTAPNRIINDTAIRDSDVAEDHDGNQDHYTEEIIQAILSAKEALEKPIEERDERDILLIDNLCSLVHGFDAFPKSVRRALAAQAVLIVIDEKGKELIVHNEELDSFCVLIFGECEQLNVAKTVPIRLYHVGDSFGVCEPTTDTIRFVGHMVTRCENCAFLCVKRDEFYTILTDPANYPNKETIRHRDRNGNVVCISQFNIEKKTSGPLWSHHQQYSNPFKIVLPDGHIIIKASEPCLLTALVDGYDRVDPEYVDDFLLLFRVFMMHDQREKEKKLPPGMIKLCLTLAKWLDHVDYRDKVVKIVLTWLSSYYHDFELDSEFSYLFFRVLESRLLNLSMKNQLHLLHVTLSTKSKLRHVTISRSSREQPLNLAISGGYEKNCGIFVTKVYGSSLDSGCPYDGFVHYLKHSNVTLESFRTAPPIAPPRHITSFDHQDSRISSQLRPGDQILEVNGINFSAIKLVEAQKKLDMSTHLSLTVKYNPSAFYEMKALPDGKRKSSLSSISSVSPYPQSNSQSKFTFSSQDLIGMKQLNEQGPPPSPLFSANTNFGLKSFVKAGTKNDKSRLTSLINSSKQLVKQIRDSTVQSSGNIDTMSKTSDNVSDDQSNDIDMNRAKSNPDLASLKGKDRQIDAGLSNIIDILSTSSINDSSNGNQSLVNVLKVYNAANNELRYLLVHEETTAREVVMVAVKEFNLTGTSGPSSPGEKVISSLNWHLYEVSVVPESRTIKQKCLSEQTSRLAERASLCSRFYIKNNAQNSFGQSKLDMGDDALVNEILKECPATVTLTSLNATLLAVELTLADFDKFKSIEPQQFVYDTFFDYSEKQTTSNSSSSSYDSASLKSSSSDGQEVDILNALNKTRSIPKSWTKEYQEFADISNKEMFWVVCEILSEKNIGRRVKIIKQFVRIADVCSKLRNFNSMFAIISGLGHNCVFRLKRTFEKLKPKYKNQLEKMRGLFDPSKNMLNYRSCLNQTQPPAIPLFPQIKKDLTFTKEGRSIFVRESNDASDDDDNGCTSQDTIKRRSRTGGEDPSKLSHNDIITSNGGVGTDHHSAPLPQTRSFSYGSFYNYRTTSTEVDTILVNFAEIRQFTERVRNVIYFSSVPYSNDLLTNTKDNQRTQAQVRKMHEEWQMRKRIRHYISRTLNESAINDQQSKTTDTHQPNSGQADTSSTKQQFPLNADGKLRIIYDERILYQRSLELEPEINTRPPVAVQSVTERCPHPSTMVAAHMQANTNQSHVLTSSLSIQTPLMATSSPTLSKSSSLSSCSSFSQHHHMPTYHGSRNALTCNVGKFGTESTESLRKLQALSENVVDDWRSNHCNSNNNNNNNGLSNKTISGDQQQNRPKGLMTSRIFPPKK